jgi:proteasome lid subunit RPN8/RPN11
VISVARDRLNNPALATVVACQRDAGTREVCGLCAIDAGGIQHFLLLTNCSGEPNRFETSAAEEALVRSTAKQLGWTIWAFVHTHVTGDVGMSEHDRRSFGRDVLPWIILSVTQTHVRQCTYSRPDRLVCVTSPACCNVTSFSLRARLRDRWR